MSTALTAEQDARAIRALATFKAKREALRAGLPLEQLDADVWVVDEDSRDSEVAEKSPPQSDRRGYVPQAIRELREPV
jgi:hypothetical protein